MLEEKVKAASLPQKLKRKSLLLGVGFAGVCLVALIFVYSSGDSSLHEMKPWSRTAMGFIRNGEPPPLAYGNRVSVISRTGFLSYKVANTLDDYLPEFVSSVFHGLSDFSGQWTVVNIHAENLDEIMKRKGMKWVKVERLGAETCLVVDPRVPRTWLRTYPLGSLSMRRNLRLERPEWFNTDPALQNLIGTTWELVTRKDSDGWLERVLPGDRIKFEDMDLICRSSGDTSVARRVWELKGSGNWLAIYDLQGEIYTGIDGRIARDGETLTFTMTGTNKGKGRGGSWSAFKTGVTEVEYRLVTLDGLQP